MVVAAVAGAVVGLISTAGGGDDLPALPADGRTPTGIGYRLAASGACLELDLERKDEVEVIGEEPWDIRACDFAGRGRAEGELALSCRERTLVVFGSAREDAGDLVLVPRRGEEVRAERHAFGDNVAFIVSAPFSALPARLRSEDGSETTLPAPGDACEPIPDGTVPDLPSGPVTLP